MKESRRNKMNMANQQFTLMDHWPTLIHPSLSFRRIALPTLPTQPKNLHNYGWKPDLNFKIRILTPPPAE
jgi:hypothetical protein